MKHVVIIIFFSLACTLVALILRQLPVHAQGAGDIVIIANKAFPADSLSMSQVKRIFYKQLTNIKGKKVVPIHAKKNTEARQIFNQKVLGMTVSEEQAYWQAEMVRSGAREPAEFRNTIRAVFAVSTSVGYCLKKDFNPAVAKQVAVFYPPLHDGKSTFLVHFGSRPKNIRF